MLDAVTQRADGPLCQTLEPTTHYALVRAQRDLRGGESGVGVILTGVARSNDAFSRDLLNRDAYVAATDFRHRFARRRSEITGSIDATRISGTPASILSTQTEAVHYYQQPGGALLVDSPRTSLSGNGEQITFGNVGGGITRSQTSYDELVTIPRCENRKGTNQQKEITSSLPGIRLLGLLGSIRGRIALRWLDRSDDRLGLGTCSQREAATGTRLRIVRDSVSAFGNFDQRHCY